MRGGCIVFDMFCRLIRLSIGYGGFHPFLVFVIVYIMYAFLVQYPFTYKKKKKKKKMTARLGVE